MKNIIEIRSWKALTDLPQQNMSCLTIRQTNYRDWNNYGKYESGYDLGKKRFNMHLIGFPEEKEKDCFEANLKR